MTLVHRCRFFEWVPEQILCLDTNSSNLLAVGRINGDIEIWNDECYYGKVCFKTISGIPNQNDLQ